MSHPIETLLLPPLHGVRKASARGGTLAAWRASCPLHNRPNQDLSLAIGADGTPLLHCFCRHDPNEVLSELGLDWTDLHPRAVAPTPLAEHGHASGRGNGGPSAWASTYAAGETALRALETAFSLLARANKPDGEQEFEEYLTSVFKASDEIQRFKKFLRAAAREGGK